MSAPPVFREWHTAPSVIPVAHHLQHRAYPLLLDSATHETTPADAGDIARYSFVAADPTMVVSASGHVVTILDTKTGTTVRQEGRILDIAREILREQGMWQQTPIAGLPPFQTGFAGYVGYEYGGQLERIPRPVSSTHVPDVVLALYPWVIAWDHQQQRTWVIGQSDDLADAKLKEFTAQAWPDLSRRQQTSARAMQNELHSSLPRDQYIQAVEQVREYITAGDVFQVNLSQQFNAPYTAPAWELYTSLRTINPAPFSAFFDFRDGAIVSASPERFLHLTASGQAETRPIKGTRPRGATPDLDSLQQQSLLNSAKDAAEHVMIVDVLRNDLARVCTYGSVRVPRLCTLESYATVHHLVSTIVGQLRPDADAIDLLHASFPGGSITGAPKVRAMEIIAELEPATRNVYCGAIGYLSATGAMDTSIAIRTILVENQHVFFSAGGGIVFDSNPAGEYQESLDKAYALILATQAPAGLNPA